MRDSEEGHSLPSPCLLLAEVGGAFPSPASSKWGGGAGEGPHSASLTLGGGGASHSCFCFQEECAGSHSQPGEGLGSQPGSLTSVPSPAPVWGGGSRGQQQGEPLPAPSLLGSGFPEREALTTHRLGDGICKGRQGLGPGRLEGRGRRQRRGGGHRTGRGADVQEGKTWETDRKTQKDRGLRDRDTQKVTEMCWEGRVPATQEEVGRFKKGQERESGMVLLKSFRDLCLILPH